MEFCNTGSPVDALAARAAGDGLGISDVPALIKALDEHTHKAVHAADMLREARFKNHVDACSIINAKSGNCPEDCGFCAQSIHYDTDARAYPLLPEAEILKAAGAARDMGIRRFCVVTSGRGGESDAELATISSCISKIRDMGIMPCATLGIMSPDWLARLRDAGLNRYHHNIETSRSFYPNICSTHGFDERLGTVRDALEAGLSVCSGGIIGMGETMEDRAEMALILKNAGVDSVPLNFLMPVPGTPLEDVPPLTPMEALKTIALFRFILPDKEIRVCGGRLSALGELHSMMFMAGANGILTGDYLTRQGRDPRLDLLLFDDLGMDIAYD